MQITRREFNLICGRGTLALAAGGSALLLDGCSVWTEIEAYVPLGIDALTSIVDLLDPALAAAVDAAAGTIKAEFNQLAAAVTDYLNAPAADKATLKEKVATILTSIGNHFQGFLNALGSSPKIAIVVKLVKIILDTLAGFGLRIGGTAATALHGSLVGGAHRVAVVPVKRSKREFISAFNREITADGHPELAIPRK
jgi:hypothetical protein